MPATRRTIVTLAASLAAATTLLGGCDAPPYLTTFGPPPVPPRHIKAAFFPLEVVPGAAGVPVNAAVGPDGDLLVAGYDTDTVYAVDRSDGTLRLLATAVTGATANVLSVAYADGVVYAGASDGRIYAVDPETGVSSELTDLGSTLAVNGLAIAPAAFPSYGGRLVAVTSESATGPGVVHAIDRSDPAQVDTVWSDAAAAYLDLAFTGGGTLYVVDQAGGRVVRVDGSGAVPVATGFGEPVGLAFDGGRARLYVADAADDTVHQVALPGGAVTPLARFQLRGGALPSGVVWDGERNLLVMTEGSSVVRGITLPRFTTAGLPATVPYTSTGVGAYTFDGAGDLWGVANGSLNSVFVIDRVSGLGEIVLEGLGGPNERLWSAAYDPARTRVYIGGTSQRIFLLDRFGRIFVLADLSADGHGAVTGMTMAPKTFVTPTGTLAAVTEIGQLLYVDPDDGSVSAIGASANLPLAGLVRAADGTLYSASPTTGAIVTVDPSDGSLSDFATGLGEPDGLVLDQLGTTLYVTDAQGDLLWAVDVPGGTATSLGARAFDDGPEPSAIVFDGLGELLLGTGETALTVEAQSVFP